MVGSSTISSRGLDIRARPSETIWRSPPLWVEVSWRWRCSSTGNRSNTILRLRSAFAAAVWAPASRLSRVVMNGNRCPRSGA